MPKIRDLGINSIPVVPRPPVMDTETWLAGDDSTSACGDSSCKEDKDRDRDHDRDEDAVTSDCGHSSCRPDDDDEQSGCGDSSCVGNDRDRLKTMTFESEVVWQLRQQLEAQLHQQ